MQPTTVAPIAVLTDRGMATFTEWIASARFVRQCEGEGLVWTVIDTRTLEAGTITDRPND